MQRCGALGLLLLLLACHAAFAGKIKHVVVLMEENRSFDHMFGWYKGVNGLTGKEWNPVSTENPSSQKIFVDKDAPMIAPCDPDHGTNATTWKIFGAAAVSKGQFINASMDGFVEWENLHGHADTKYCRVMSMMTPEHIPVLSTMASEFAIMDEFFASHAGPTWPNRLFMLSATSAGLTSTGPWYQMVPGKLFPQKTFFDQLQEEGLTWRAYYNDTPWELFLGGIAHNPEHLSSLEEFFEDARTGDLPAFAWINPRSGINVTLKLGSNDQHPDHDVALGEEYYKSIYEALRASPAWPDTLFVVTYDEHGGFYDHVPTPLNVPPPGDGEPSYPEKGVLFNRLGVRLPTLLISPWIPKGLVISAPPDAQKPFHDSRYDLTSIMATTRKLLGMRSGPLTKRDAWAATFEQALSLSSPRTDCPMHLPPPPPPSRGFSPEEEAAMPLNDLQRHMIAVHAHLAGVPMPLHIERQGHVSAWMQRQFGRHAHHTLLWKRSKAEREYDLLVQPSSGPDWESIKWDVNKGSHVSFNTLSLRHPTAGYCLDYGSAPPESDRLVGVSKCYPSSHPDTNRDHAQQWFWMNDSTVRPAADTSLCLETLALKGDRRNFLRPCSGGPEQHWAWSGGHAPGNGNGGHISFGPRLLGVVRAKKTVVA